MENRCMENDMVSFISCVNNKAEYEICLNYINKLNFGDVKYEIITVDDAKSLTEGYNRGMKKAKGKYKIYLHQDTYILNKNFVLECIKFFQNKSIGMLGVIGTEKIPASCMWSSGKHIYGGVLDNSISGGNIFTSFPTEDFEGNLKEVMAVDGLILITQYDIPWREDLFDGWHFYDISQCIEFKRKGYKVCVPKQSVEIWVKHACGKVSLNNYEKYRRIFIEEYAGDIFWAGRLIPKLWNLNKKTRPYQQKIEKLVKMCKFSD